MGTTNRQRDWIVEGASLAHRHVHAQRTSWRRASVKTYFEEAEESEGCADLFWAPAVSSETEVATLKHQVATLTEMLSKVVEHVAEKDRQERLAAASRSGLDQLIRQLESGASNIDLSDVALPPGLLSSLAE